jgi:hydrogenase-4 component F
MTAIALVALPLLMAVVTFLTPSKRWRPRLVAATAVAHLALTVRVIVAPEPAAPGAWLALDPLGQLLLGLVSLVFLACALYAIGYLRYRVERANRRFTACLLATLAAMTLVAEAQHLGLLWVGIEATTLATAPLIYFNRTPRSIEATWKYLFLSSVGIAIALFGSFMVGYASLAGGGEPSLLFGELVARAPLLSKPWLRAGFALLLTGYGTKMGLAPMHNWKPDAYGEAPGVAGAILAGGLTSCAFVAILRIQHLLTAAGEGVWAGRLLVLLGLLSMAVAGTLMLGQRDLKRMLAFSSVEHMGILTLAAGVGGGALFGGLLHLVNNGLLKPVMFLAVGNLHRAFGGKTTDEVRGGLRRLPLSGGALLFGFLAITGSPPFGPFVSELLVLRAIFADGRWLVGGLFLLFLLVAFAGMGVTTLAALQGKPPLAASRSDYRDGLFTFAPIAVLLLLSAVLGLHLPAALDSLLRDAAASLLGPS